MRVLAIDLGARRTGLAAADTITRIVSPLDVIQHSDKPGHREPLVDAAVRDHGPDALLVGIPLNMDGTPGSPAREAQAWAREAGRRLGLPVHEVDERQTSEDADAVMARSGMTHKQKRARRDALAAAAIAQRWLDGQ